MLSLIITNDYEVLGDGRGDVEDILLHPTREILAVSDRFHAPHTLFVDVLEYLKFRDAEAEGVFSSRYRAATAIEKQLRDAVRRGHDVQLHLHPQWIDATPLREDSWRVNVDYWRLSDVPGGLGSVEDLRSLRGLFYLGKRTLEDLLRPVDPEYRCVAFRAGGYCIQPEPEILQAMREQGFSIDSSVAPGLWQDRTYSSFDFRSAPDDRPFWYITDRVSRPESTGDLLELPVFTGSFVPGLRSNPLARDYPAARAASIPRGTKRPPSSRPPLLKRILGRFVPRRFPLDFCKLNSDEMIRMVEEARSRYDAFSEEEGPMPLIMSGHSKEWPGERNFREFLEWATGRDWLKFSTFPEWLKTRRSGCQEGRTDRQSGPG